MIIQTYLVPPDDKTLGAKNYNELSTWLPERTSHPN